AASLLFLVLTAAPAAQSPSELVDMPTCLPIAQRTRDAGCWIITDQPVGRVAGSSVNWRIDTFPTRAAAAEAAKRPAATVVDALGKIWLMTVGDAAAAVPGGEHVATIGPLPVHPGTEYSATYMEAIFTPGMESAT